MSLNIPHLLTWKNAKSVDIGKIPKVIRTMTMIEETCPLCHFTGQRYDNLQLRDHLCTGCMTRYDTP